MGYEAVQTAVQGLEVAGSEVAPRHIAEAIAGLEMETARGGWTFSRLGESWQAPAGFALLTVKDGKIIDYRP